MKVTFLGHACLLVETDDYSVIIDPFITGNPLTNINPKDIRVDAIIITHGHSDHVGDTIDIALNNNCEIVVINELGTYLAMANSNLNIHRLSIGGAHEFSWGKVKLTPAAHSIDVNINNKIFGHSAPAGVLLTMEGKTLYHPGDTGLFMDMELIGRTSNIDLAVLPIGGNFTMDIDDSIIAAGMLNAKKYFPIHYNTFYSLRQNDKEWLEKMHLNNFDAVIVEVNNFIKI